MKLAPFSGLTTAPSLPMSPAAAMVHAPLSAAAATAARTATPVVRVAADPTRTPVPLSYDFDLKLDTAARSLSGRGTITVRNDSTEPLTEVYLRLWGNTPSLTRDGGATTLSNVSVAGAAATASVDKTVAKVALATALAPGESTTISFDTTMTVPSRMGRTGTGRDGTLFFGNMLPVLAVKDDEGWNLDPYVVMGESFYNLASDWKVKLTTATDQQLITTGSAGAATTNAATGMQTIEFNAPHVRDFIVVAPKDYAQVSAVVDGVTVRSWAPKGDTKTAQSALKTATESLKFYSDRYGKYGSSEYDVVATKELGGGMEYPGVTLNDMGGFQSREVVAHETGHQWFYSMVGNNEFDDPWLDGSFTSFITSEFLHQSVNQTADNLRPAFNERAANLGRPAPIVETTTRDDVHVSSPMNVLVQHDYFGVIYRDGANVLANLKKQLGEDTFVKGMRSHLEANRDGVATTGGFIKTMSAAAGSDLTKWFEAQRVFASEPAANVHLDPNGTL